jgi:hypothetical protein
MRSNYRIYLILLFLTHFSISNTVGDFAPLNIGTKWEYAINSTLTPFYFPMSNDSAISESLLVSFEIKKSMSSSRKDLKSLQPHALTRYLVDN